MLQARGRQRSTSSSATMRCRGSGTEVIRLAREARPQLPAVIITGYADGEEIGGRPADVGLLMKPFTLAELSGAVDRAFDGVTAP